MENIDKTDYHWFLESQREHFKGDSVYQLPYDQHELCAMVCPRALLLLGNPDYPWLADDAMQPSAEAAKKVEEIKTKAAKLIHTDVSPIEWERYLVNDGKVSIKPEYKQIITDRFSIYIDTDSRSAVYEKWLAMEKAIKEFNQAVKEAPKVSTFYDSMVKINHPSADLYNPQYLMGLAVPDRFSLARLDPDGSIVLKGKNFEYIK